MKENWKPFIENPYYEISDLGNVKNITTDQNLTLDNYGRYSLTTLYIKGKPVKKSVHRLVANLFVPNPDNKPHVNHKNSNTKDNRAVNLEWCTAKENVTHSILFGKRKNYGEFNYCSKLTNEETSFIKNNLNVNYSAKELAYLFNVSLSTIYNIIENVTFKNVL